MPVACLVTDGLGSILNANRAAGVFLNVSAKHLKDRQLLVFFADRHGFNALMQRLARHWRTSSDAVGAAQRAQTKETDILVVPLSNGHSGLWLWFLDPSRPSPPAHVAREAGQQVESFS